MYIKHPFNYTCIFKTNINSQFLRDWAFDLLHIKNRLYEPQFITNLLLYHDFGPSLDFSVIQLHPFSISFLCLQTPHSQFGRDCHFSGLAFILTNLF